MDAFLDYNYFVQFDVVSANGKVIYRGIKKPQWGTTQYKIINLVNQEEYHIFYISRQTLSPVFLIQSTFGKFKVKKDILDWARLDFIMKIWR